MTTIYSKGWEHRYGVNERARMLVEVSTVRLVDRYHEWMQALREKQLPRPA